MKCCHFWVFLVRTVYTMFETLVNSQWYDIEVFFVGWREIVITLIEMKEREEMIKLKNAHQK